ncbi:hypothetical protein SSCG_00644 [Streptomyces clavuligerus]|nr:hypothetical protein SSCG_00644 [Streptomyces clavuligerus]
MHRSLLTVGEERSCCATPHGAADPLASEAAQGTDIGPPPSTGRKAAVPLLPVRTTGPILGHGGQARRAQDFQTFPARNTAYFSEP